MPDLWPTEIRLNADKKNLVITFDDDRIITLSAELLRVESPSAEVQGHTPSQKKTIVGKQNIIIHNIEAVGNYAIRLIFDDGHDSGLYTWNYLYQLATSGK
jgi:DUF971 family protein